MMKYLKGAALFVAGFAFTTGVFLLGLLAWGEEFEHASPQLTDGYFFAWLAVSVLVGAIAFWLCMKRQPK